MTTIEPKSVTQLRANLTTLRIECENSLLRFIRDSNKETLKALHNTTNEYLAVVNRVNRAIEDI